MLTFGTNINPLNANNTTQSLGSSSYKWKVNGYIPEIIVVTVTASNETSVSVQNDNITADHIVINQCAMVTHNVSYETSAGYLTLSSEDGIPAMTLYLLPRVV